MGFVKIQMKKLRETSMVPEYGSELAAGADLRADIPERISIAPGETRMVPTGIALSLPAGYFGGIYARSGLSSKEGLRPANCVGVVDADYTGEVMVALHNDGSDIRTVSPNQRIAQLVIQPYVVADFEIVDELVQTDRGGGGFGSTGEN